MPKPRRLSTLVIFIVCCLAVGATAYYVFVLPTANQEDQTNLDAVVHSKSSDPIVIDSDWQKAFYDTSTSSLNRYVAAAKKTPVKLNSTEQFSRELFSQYVELRQAGVMSTSSIANSISYSVLTKDYTGTDKPKSYTMSSVHVVQNADAVTLRQYGNDLGLLLKTYTPQTNDVTVTFNAIKANDTTFTKTLAQNAAKYKAILSGLLAMKVPAAVSQNHLDLVNGMSQMIYLDGALSVAKTDPVKTMAAMNTYSNITVGLLFNAINSIKQALMSAKLSYSASEGGAYFILNQK